LLAWAPRRVELYTTPPQSAYPQDWLQQLAIHEFRHVVQVGKIEQNIPIIISLILGQQGSALVTGAYLPFWFLEGDAVVAETALSKFGRGRLPSFLMEHQAQVVENGVYSFSKAYLGSFKDYVPNHYNLGYYLVGGARVLYGKDIWPNALANVAEKPFSLTPFNHALKKQTGKNQAALYRQVFDSLAVTWKQNDRKPEGVIQISKPAKTFTNYRYNYLFNDTTIVSYKTALNSTGRFVFISQSGQEEKIHTPGVLFDESVSLTGNRLAWAEQVPDTRWNHSGKSLILVMNLENKAIQHLKPEFIAFSPAVSPDLQKVAVVEADYRSNYYLSVYDLNSGKLAARFQTEKNEYLITPRWIDEKRLAVIALTSKGKVLAIADPFKKTIEILLDESFGDIKHPVVSGGKVYFVSSYDGSNSLYVADLKSRTVFRVFRPRFGAEYPAVSENGEKIIFSDYTSGGFRLVQLPINQENLKPIDEVEKGVFGLAEKLAGQEQGLPDFSTAGDSVYRSKKYGKTAHLFHFHSWAPVFVDVGSYSFQPGVSLMSQNKLGTAETTLGYKWDLDEKTGKFYGAFTYLGWYPVISIEAGSGKRASEYLSITNYLNSHNQIVRSDTVSKRYSWNETTFDADIRLPVNLSRGKFLRLFQPEIRYEISSASKNQSTPSNFNSGILHAFSYRLYFHQVLRQSVQDMYPDFGVIAEISYRNSPFGDFDIGDLVCAQAVTYLPGILPNHGLRLYNGYQVKNEGPGYTFSDQVSYPRGWGNSLNNEMYSFSADYKFPLFCPDLSLGKLVYLKRVKTALFCDYAHQKGNIYSNGTSVGNYSRTISSVGLEITSDMNFLRFYAPVDLGFRAAYLPEAGEMNFTLLFSIDFTSF